MENVKAVILKSPFQDLMLVGCGVKGERRGKRTGWMRGLGLRMADGSSLSARSMGGGIVESRDKPSRGGSELTVSVGHPK